MDDTYSETDTYQIKYILSVLNSIGFVHGVEEQRKYLSEVFKIENPLIAEVIRIIITENSENHKYWHQKKMDNLLKYADIHSIN